MVDQVTEDQMSPGASPGELSRKSGVRRVNNLPVYLVGGVMTVFLAIMVLVAADRAAQQNKPNAGGEREGRQYPPVRQRNRRRSKGWNHSAGGREAAAGSRTLCAPRPRTAPC
jgi:hypothetical protein